MIWLKANRSVCNDSEPAGERNDNKKTPKMYDNFMQIVFSRVDFVVRALPFTAAVTRVRSNFVPSRCGAGKGSLRDTDTATPDTGSWGATDHVI